MGALAVPMLIGSTLLTGASQVMQGREQSRAAAFEQQQLQVQAENTRIAADQAETRRREELTSSLEAIQSIRAGRGVGQGSPTGTAIFDSIISDTERDIGTERFNYLSKADASRMAAEMSGRKAKTSLMASYLSAGATVGSAGFKYASYGAGGGSQRGGY